MKKLLARVRWIWFRTFHFAHRDELGNLKSGGGGAILSLGLIRA